MARSDLAGDGQSEARAVLVAPAPPEAGHRPGEVLVRQPGTVVADGQLHRGVRGSGRDGDRRSEEHTSELQSRQYLVCRLLLEKKKNQEPTDITPKNKLHETIY